MVNVCVFSKAPSIILQIGRPQTIQLSANYISNSSSLRTDVTDRRKGLKISRLPISTFRGRRNETVQEFLKLLSRTKYHLVGLKADKKLKHTPK